MDQLLARRNFLCTTVVALWCSASLPRSLFALTSDVAQTIPHPTPRRGITAGKLPPRAQLADVPDVSAVFDLVREIPGVADGIRCNCSCAGSAGSRSLLSCYELPDLMAKTCDMCKAQARLAHRMRKSGKSLDEIRNGIDARFG